MEGDQESSGIGGLKQILIDTLEAEGRLDAIKADVRATVFAALNTKLSQGEEGGRAAKRRTSSRVSELLKSEAGTKALEGVIELLRWAGLNQTLRVLECEVPLRDSTRLQRAFGKPDEEDGEPTLVKALRGKAVGGGEQTPPTRSPLPKIRGSPSPSNAVQEVSGLPDLSSQTRHSPMMDHQTSSVSVYSEITEEIEEVLSFVEESSALDVQDSGLHIMDSVLHAVNSTLSASDNSGELDSDAEGIEAAEM